MQFSPKMARQFAGLTQVEMAEKLGVSRDTYRRIEAHPETATISIVVSTFGFVSRYRSR